MVSQWAENIIWEDEPRLQGSCSCPIIQLDVKARRLPLEATGSWFGAPRLHVQNTGTTKERGGVHPFALIGNDATGRRKSCISKQLMQHSNKNHLLIPSHATACNMLHLEHMRARVATPAGHQLEGQTVGSRLRAMGSR